MKSIKIDISPGEFFDRVAILLVKETYLTEPLQIANVRRELDILQAISISYPVAWVQPLIDLHHCMWLNNEKRKQAIADKAFDGDYVSLTIEESRLNNERFRLKDEINKTLGSDLREQKSAVYQT